jgi:opacity protein-like surface antigen
MNTTRLLVLSALCAGVGAVTASAGITLRGSLLYNSPGDLDLSGTEEFSSSLDEGMGASLALGYKFSILHLEAEAMTLKNDVGGATLSQAASNGDLNRLIFFANATVDVPFPVFDPYIGIGVGFGQADLDYSVSFNNASNFSLSEKESTFGGQIMAGVRFSMFETVNIAAGYRYLYLDPVDLTALGETADYGGGEHLFELSVGIGF